MRSFTKSSKLFAYFSIRANKLSNILPLILKNKIRFILFVKYQKLNNKINFVLRRVMSLITEKSGLSLVDSDQHFLSKSLISLEQMLLSKDGLNPNFTCWHISFKNS